MDPQRRAYLIEAAAEAQPYPPEAALAKAWLQAHLDQYDDLDWQVRVGLGVQIGGDYDESIQKMAYHATRKRIDLVAIGAYGATIIELKDHVDLAAVRQARDYADLWQISPIDPPLSAVVVVGRTGDAAIADTAAALGVTVELLPLVQVP
jgi:hypothetical protein